MNRKERRAGKKLAPQGHLGAASRAGAGLLDKALENQRAGNFAEAERLCREALAGNARDADAAHLLGLIALQTERAALAIESLQKAVALNGSVATFHSNLGWALRANGRLEEAVACFRKAIALKPDYIKAQSNLAATLKELGSSFDTKVRLEDAVACYTQALELSPNDAATHNAVANTLMNLGRIEAALGHYRASLKLRPDDAATHSNFLMSLHSSARVRDAEILDEAQAFGRRVEQQRVAVTHANTRDPERRLRIGYVSADFRTHPVAFFLANVLSAHDPNAVETICYSNSTYTDAMTARLRSAANEWRVIAGVSDADASAMIRNDGVDILVDLAGHTSNNRLPLFALKPAPVQMTWLGYFGTTGLTTIDYIIADRVVVPPGEEPQFTEKVLRLGGGYLCYAPPGFGAPVAPSPMIANGFVTFGCFNNVSKLTDETIAAWARILTRVEKSRLFLKAYGLTDAACRAHVTAQFAAHGIEDARLILEGFSPLAEALTAYNRVDVALDPFPFGGCTTTADALSMGVPLVTLRGTRWSGRMSASILAALDLNEWVAPDVDAYVATACGVATGLSAGITRADLRRRMETSALCDGQRFTQTLEAAYRAAWNAWCAKTMAG